MEPFTIGVALGLGALILSGKKGPPGGRLPEPDTKDLVDVTEWKKTLQGLARYFRKEFIPSIAINLKPTVAVKVADGVYKGARVLVYRIYENPAQASGASYPTIDLCKIAHDANAAVLVTTNFWIRSGGPFYLAVIPYAQRAEWSNLGRQWAIEFDDQAGEDSAPPVKGPGKINLTDRKKYASTEITTPGGTSTTSAWDFDSNMTPEEKESAAALMLREDLDPAFYEAQAQAAEQMGHAGTTHGTHPKCAKLFRTRAAQLQKKLEPPKVEPPKSWGTPQAKEPPPQAKEPPPQAKEPPPADDVAPPEPMLPYVVQPFMSQGGVIAIESPASIAAEGAGDWQQYTEIARLNPAIKKTGAPEGASTGLSPWPPPGPIWLPAAWLPNITIKSTAPIPTADNTPPPGDGGGGIFGPWEGFG